MSAACEECMCRTCVHNYLDRYVSFYSAYAARSCILISQPMADRYVIGMYGVVYPYGVVYQKEKMMNKDKYNLSMCHLRRARSGRLVEVVQLLKST